MNTTCCFSVQEVWWDFFFFNQTRHPRRFADQVSPVWLAICWCSLGILSPRGNSAFGGGGGVCQSIFICCSGFTHCLARWASGESHATPPSFPWGIHKCIFNPVLQNLTGYLSGHKPLTWNLVKEGVKRHIPPELCSQEKIQQEIKHWHRQAEIRERSILFQHYLHFLYPVTHWTRTWNSY